MKRHALFGLITSIIAFIVVMGIAIWRGIDAPPSAPVVELQATTTVEGSGLLSVLTNAFAKETGIKVRALAFGTGQVLKNAMRGDADVVLVHDRKSEDEFIAQGYGVERRDVMYNDFVIVGPSGDPAGVKSINDVALALEKIAQRSAQFVSRGDDSGTHKAEQALWVRAGVDVSGSNHDWYMRAGLGMGATLTIAIERGAYTICDRASIAAYNEKDSYGVLVENDPPVRNVYGVILVGDSESKADERAKNAQAFVDWVTGDSAQRLIGEFRVDGRQVYFPVGPVDLVGGQNPK